MPRPKAKPRNPRDPETTLDLPDRFYIENNGQLSVEEIASHLNKSVELIQDYVNDYLAKHPVKPKAPRTKTLIDRPAKGVTSMTEAASMSGDDGYMKTVTMESINRAMADGNLELAKELKVRLDEQNKKNKEVIKSKYRPILHYIQSPDDDAEVY